MLNKIPSNFNKFSKYNVHYLSRHFMFNCHLKKENLSFNLSVTILTVYLMIFPCPIAKKMPISRRIPTKV